MVGLMYLFDMFYKRFVPLKTVRKHKQRIIAQFYVVYYPIPSHFERTALRPNYWRVGLREITLYEINKCFIEFSY